MQLVVDPFNTSNVVANGQIYIYDSADTDNSSPLVLTDPNGLALTNPLMSNSNGFLPPFLTSVPQVKWAGSGFVGYFDSYVGLRDEAVAAKDAAATSASAAVAAAAQAQAPTDSMVDAGIVRADLPGKINAIVPDLVGAQVPPLVAPLVASAIASDPTVAQSAADLAQATAGLVKQMPALTSGANLNSLTTIGVYPVATGSVASSLLNAPPGFVNPGSITVTQASASNNVIQQTVRMYWTGGLTRVFTRQSIGGTFPSSWETEKVYMGTVPNATNWNSVSSPGVYSLDSITNANTMTNLPPTPGGFAGAIEVMPITSSRVIQRAVEYGTGTSGTQWTRSQNIDGSFPAWSIEGGKAIPLTVSSDLDTLFTAGSYKAETSAVVTAVTGKPNGTAQPFHVAVTVLSVVNGIYSQVVTEWTGSGPKISRRVSLSGTYQGWMTDSPALAEPGRTTVTCLGDSLTEGGDINGAWAPGEDWPAKLGVELGLTVRNYGRSGDTSDEMMIRVGAHQPYFTVSGGQIPASGAVSLTTTQVFDFTTTNAWTGTLNGVTGTLTWTVGNTWSFTRSGSGSAVPVSGKARFTGSQADCMADTLTICIGRNDLGFGGTGMEQTKADHIVGNIARLVEWATPRAKNIVLAGVTNTTTETAGSAGFLTVVDINNRLRTMFPGKFADLQRYLSTTALAEAGFTPTSADTAAMAEGRIPPQLYSANDTTHFKPVVATAISQFMARYLRGKGWV